ncbi:OsmC family protein [Weeksellaceae bacterium KMM 9713]|uniref:OsmC family protein n=1 Tax=Profundicola chukchiensis TaxID=2961959 RepID=A0A9X4MYW6_9FLAO|nr:OsmC family protein [Profundicola chukchiensis]MDG4946135.1 OsmC family protein [Profundicola chukchiensis]MDG4951115.1 OsmC family protein [Profundicola chukchiensis]
MSDERISFELPEGGFAGVAQTRGFSWNIDEPEDKGGTNTAPTPMETLYGALAACVAITVRMYAERKEWETGEIKVEVYAEENENRQKEIFQKVTYGNAANLTEEQIKRLDLIATKCPVSKTLQQATPVIHE